MARRRPGGVARRTIPAVMIAVLVGGSSYTLTAANTVPATKAGSGAGAVTGYTVTDEKYTIDVLNNPRQLLSSTLNLAGNVPSTTSVRVRFRAAGSWYSCTMGAYTLATDKTAVACSVTGESSLTATNLTAVAAQ